MSKKGRMYKWKRENILGMYFEANVFLDAFKRGMLEYRDACGKQSEYCWPPFCVVMCSFACELYLKFIIASERMGNDRCVQIEGVHCLDELFSLVSSNTKNEIINATGYVLSDFQNMLLQMKNDFEKWRYIYSMDESSQIWDYTFANLFSKALSATSKRICEGNEYCKYGPSMSLGMYGSEENISC